jgi:ribosomal protein L29
MKKKDRQAITQSEPTEIVKQVSELTKKLATLTINRYTIQSKNVRERKNIRLQVALLKTVLRQKELLHGNV